MEELKHRIEEEDAKLRAFGTTQEQKDAWGVKTNVGYWIIGRQTAEFLRDLVLTERPKQILEIGTSVGYSTLWLAEAVKTYGGKVATIEIEAFKSKMAKAHFAEANLNDVVTLYTESFEDVAKWWKDPIDFLFLDANKNGYLTAFQLFEPFLTPNAVVVADNVLDMRDRLEGFLQHLTNHEDFETQMHEIDHGIFIARKKA